jgi:hypothetical protein
LNQGDAVTLVGVGNYEVTNMAIGPLFGLALADAQVHDSVPVMVRGVARFRCDSCVTVGDHVHAAEMGIIRWDSSGPLVLGVFADGADVLL